MRNRAGLLVALTFAFAANPTTAQPKLLDKPRNMLEGLDEMRRSVQFQYYSNIFKSPILPKFPSITTPPAPPLKIRMTCSIIDSDKEVQEFCDGNRMSISGVDTKPWGSNDANQGYGAELNCPTPFGPPWPVIIEPAPATYFGSPRPSLQEILDENKSWMENHLKRNPKR